MADTKTIGRRPEDILEGGAGGEWHRALLLSDLLGNLEAVAEEFSYDLTDEARDLLRLAADLQSHVDKLAVTGNADLTANKECRACGGEGRYGSVDPCEECDGTGIEVDASSQEDPA
jgi:hypothetical protein